MKNNMEKGRIKQGIIIQEKMCNWVEKKVNGQKKCRNRQKKC